MAKKKKSKRISWKTEYYKLAKKASNDLQEAVSDLSGFHKIDPHDVSEKLDGLSYKYDKLAKKAKPRK